MNYSDMNFEEAISCTTSTQKPLSKSEIKDLIMVYARRILKKKWWQSKSDDIWYLNFYFEQLDNSQPNDQP